MGATHQAVTWRAAGRAGAAAFRREPPARSQGFVTEVELAHALGVTPLLDQGANAFAHG
jgi:hypothetical protein